MNMALDKAKEDEIAGHYDHSDYPCESRNRGRENGAAETGAECEEEREEREAAGDGVQDHDAREGFGGVC